MEKLFLHACCGPCSAYPLVSLFRQNPRLKILLWWYNPNIHPLSEYQRRRDSLAYLALRVPSVLASNGQAGQGLEGTGLDLATDFSAPYHSRLFLAQAALSPEEPERCRRCYALRLEAAAREAALRGYPAFSTTLLFSRQQKHELLIEEGRKAGQAHGLDFYYRDFREGYKEGREIAKSLGLYAQRYCGCVYGASAM